MHEQLSRYSAPQAARESDLERILLYNERLEKAANLTGLNEPFLEEVLEELENAFSYLGRPYWLSFARLTELALLCAGNYADNGFASGVGDLLFNPRLILVRIPGEAPVIKERHTPLTMQFRHKSSTRQGVIEWLKRWTTLETIKPALLPYMHFKLGQSGFIAEGHLSSIMERMHKIADTTALLLTGNMRSEAETHKWLNGACDSDRKMIKVRLCGFDTRIFDALGADVWNTCRGKPFHSGFLI